MGLGTYPVVSPSKLVRDPEPRLPLSQGLDPIRVRDEEREAYIREHETPDFASFATEHHAEIKDQWKNRKHAQQWINTLTRQGGLGCYSLDALTWEAIDDCGGKTYA